MTALFLGYWTSEYDPREEASQGQRDLYTQLIISIALGLTAFIAFCVSRVRMCSCEQSSR